MAVIGWLAARARVPVLIAAGGGARDAVHDLLARPELRPVRSPREATVLVLVGRMPRTLVRPASLVHDQLPHPRGTVWWTGGPRGELADTFGEEEVGGSADDVVDVLVRLHADLVRGDRASDDPLLPSVPPRRWRGVGPHGQGGMGMMGGAPYGRPMAMTGEDRDGLQLDEVPATIGPFLVGWPPGLALDVTLQGDVLTDVTVRANPFAADDPFRAPLGGGVTAEDGDRPGRALYRLASVLDHHGLDALASRARSLASGGALGSPARQFARRLRRSRTLRWAMAGVGVIDPAAVGGLPTEDRDALGGDAWDRFRRILDDVERTAAGEPPRSSADGRRTIALLDHVPALLAGAEIGDAMTTIASLDLDLEAAAAALEVAG